MNRKNVPMAAALKLHAMGFNVCAIARRSKRPAHAWNDPLNAPWTVVRQPVAVVRSLGHQWSQQERVVNGQVLQPIDRVGVICGIGDLRCIDVDAVKDDNGEPAAPTPEEVYVLLLDGLGLPSDYRWGGRSSSGAGWHILVRCPDSLPWKGGVARFSPIPDYADRFGAIELRWHSCQTALPRTGDVIGYHPDMLESAPATVSLDRILRAVAAIAVPSDDARPPTPPARNGTHPPEADDVAAILHWLAGAVPGQRHPRLYRAAYQCGRLFANGACGEATKQTLIDIGARIGLPDEETRRTVEDGWSAGAAAGARPPTKRRAPPPERRTVAPVTVLWGAEIDRIPPPTPLIDGVLTIGKTTLLVGPSEAGKSTVAIHIACLVAQRYPSIYVAAESADMVRNQIRAWEQTHHASRGLFGLVPHAVPLPDGVDSLIDAVIAARARLVVLDTLSACLTGVDENDARDMSAVIEAINRLAAAASAAALVLHHPNKSGSSAFRGHSLIVNNTHTLLRLTPNPDRHGVVTLVAERHKGVRIAPLHLAIGTATIQETIYADPRYGALTAPTVLPPAAVADEARSLTAVQRTLLTLLAELDAEGGADTRDLARMVCERERVSESLARAEIARAAQATWISPHAPPALRRLTEAGRAALARDRECHAPVTTLAINPHLPPHPGVVSAADAAATTPPSATVAPDDAGAEEVWHDC